MPCQLLSGGSSTRKTSSSLLAHQVGEVVGRGADAWLAKVQWVARCSRWVRRADTWESRDAHQRGGIRVHVEMSVSVRRNLGPHLGVDASHLKPDEGVGGQGGEGHPLHSHSLRSHPVSTNWSIWVWLTQGSCVPPAGFQIWVMRGKPRNPHRPTTEHFIPHPILSIPQFGKFPLPLFLFHPVNLHPVLQA